jgi:hypothetical protein
VEDRRSGEGEDGGVEDTTSRSTSTEMARSSVTVRVRESETERDEEDMSTEAPERRRRGRERRAESGDRRWRRWTRGETAVAVAAERRGAAERVRGAIGN